MLLPANACVIILRCGRPVSRPFTKIIAKDYMDDIDYILWFTSMIWTLYHNICRMRRSGSSSNPPSPTRKTRRLSAARFSAFGHLEGGFERRLLATVRWTVETAVAFPQKSESTFPHQEKDLRKQVLFRRIPPMRAGRIRSDEKCKENFAKTS